LAPRSEEGEGEEREREEMAREGRETMKAGHKINADWEIFTSTKSLEERKIFLELF
jgi:hypothetical protein